MQKRGQVRLLDAATETPRGSADSVEPEPEMTSELVESPVRQRLLRELPHAFVGIELWGVAGEGVEVKAGEATTQGPNRLALVDRAPIPKQHHRAAEMAEQMPDEVADLRMPEVLRVETVVQAETAAARAHGDSRDDGDPVSPLVVVNDGRLSARGPRLVNTRDQEEARLVGEDEVGTQPRGFFLMRGHSSRFQRLIRSSLSSRARRSGFW